MFLAPFTPAHRHIASFGEVANRTSVVDSEVWGLRRQSAARNGSNLIQ